MNFPLFEDVVLLEYLPDEGLEPGDIGVVVDEHEAPGVEKGYSVEFFDMLGNTVAVVTLPGSSLRRPTYADRPVIRQTAPHLVPA